jgi:hypothetical protein
MTMKFWKWFAPEPAVEAETWGLSDAASLAEKDAQIAKLTADLKKANVARAGLHSLANRFLAERDEAHAKLARINNQRMVNLAKAQAANAERRAAKMAGKLVS